MISECMFHEQKWRLEHCDAAVLIVLGQSNAHGHGLFMQESDQIRQPLQHVFGLSRTHNQSLDLKQVTWSGYTSHDMNLGETQDHTCCLATELARIWQREFDGGNSWNLPDLYIIQISIGAQGVSLVKGEKNNMWYPYREEKLIPGPLGTVDISLYPFTLNTLNLAMTQLRASKKNPVIIGLHWSGGNDCSIPLDQFDQLETHYRTMVDGFHRSIGQACSQYIYEQLAVVRMKDLGFPVAGLHENNRVYRRLADTIDFVKIISARQSPYWQEGTVTNGIFVDDHVHYTADVQKWFAEQQFLDLWQQAIWQT